jgi:uncharacterized protein
VHLLELTAAEQRVLGCLIEKRFTTPEQYPLTLNALRLACNQSTNRDPVVNYDEDTVRDAAQRLTRYGVARLASGHSSRATKYRHLAEEGLGVDSEQLALLCVLLLRGAQTPGELKGRTDRMVPFATLGDVERVLDGLIERGYVRRIARRPGQKEDRFEQLLGGQADGVAKRPDPAAGAAASAPAAAVSATEDESFTTPRADEDHLPGRVATLEAEVGELRDQLAALAHEVTALRDQVGSARPTM